MASVLPSTVQQPKGVSFGSMTTLLFEVTCSGVAGYVVTGLHNVWFAISTSETASEASDAIVFNSDDGTAGTLAGAVYLPAEGENDVLQVLVLGW